MPCCRRACKPTLYLTFKSNLCVCDIIMHKYVVKYIHHKMGWDLRKKQNYQFLNHFVHHKFQIKLCHLNLTSTMYMSKNGDSFFKEIASCYYIAVKYIYPSVQNKECQ